MLVADLVLPVARPGAGGAVEPRLRRRLRRRDDAEGSEARAGSGRCVGRADTPLGGAAEALYAELVDRGYGGKDFSVMLEMLRGRV